MRITSPTQESQADETFSEVFYFRYFPFPIEREALFSQAFRLTIRAAGPLAGRFSRGYTPVTASPLHACLELFTPLRIRSRSAKARFHALS